MRSTDQADRASPPFRGAWLPSWRAASELGRLFSDVGAAGVNIEDFSLEHSAGQSAGIALISVLPAAAQRLEEALDAQGWRVVAG